MSISGQRKQSHPSQIVSWINKRKLSQTSVIRPVSRDSSICSQETNCPSTDNGVDRLDWQGNHQQRHRMLRFHNYQLLSRANVFKEAMNADSEYVPGLSDLSLFSKDGHNSHKLPRRDHRATIVSPSFDVQDCGDGLVVITHNAVTFLCIRDSHDWRKDLLLEINSDASSDFLIPKDSPLSDQQSFLSKTDIFQEPLFRGALSKLNALLAAKKTISSKNGAKLDPKVSNSTNININFTSTTTTPQSQNISSIMANPPNIYPSKRALPDPSPPLGNSKTMKLPHSQLGQ